MSQLGEDGFDAERSARALITAVLTARDFETDPTVAAVLDEVRLVGDPETLALHLIQWAHFAFSEANDIAEDVGAGRIEIDELRAQVVEDGTSPVIAARIAECMGLLDLPIELVVRDMTRIIGVLINFAGDRGMVAITTFFGHSLGRAVRLLPEPPSLEEMLAFWFLEADAAD